MDRRSFIHGGTAAAGSMLLARSAEAQRATLPPTAPGGQVGVTTPDGGTLPMRTVRGVKIGHLVVGAFEHEFMAGLVAECWGYNGATPGPTIEVVEGDRVRLYVTNRLPEPTTVHWHGIIVPNGMDGVSGLNQLPIPPGETYAYEFTLRHPGTFMYHSHHDEMVQIALGAVGMFVVHPRTPRGLAVAHDFVMMTQEWRIDAGARRPDPTEMIAFNVLTFNGKAFPGTSPLVVGRGERVRVRLGNLGPMNHHPIHLHGLHFKVTATDGGDLPETAQHRDTTVLVPVGATRVIEFVPEVSGDWAMHCHMTHHVMNQMGHGSPNMVGADTRSLDRRMSRVLPSYMSMGTAGMGAMGEMGGARPPNSVSMRGGQGPFSHIGMGGMFTIVKVRDDPARADPAGWYQQPEGTVTGPANVERMRADGVDPERRYHPRR